MRFPPGPPDLVIFDCDGVLIDSESIACRVDAECLTDAGFATTADEIRMLYVGVSAADQFADIERRHGRALDAGFADLIHRRLTDAFDRELAAVPGIEAVIDALPCPSCVASSSAPERLAHTLGLVGLQRRFAPNIFSASQVARGKPFPDLFLFAAERMGAAPAGCTVVEDSLPGVRAAVAAGMRVVGFTAGSHCLPDHDEALRQAGAFAVAADASELAGILSGRP
ncbi:MAG: HAD family hydrolase [Alphaproteobacteria bacterium]